MKTATYQQITINFDSKRNAYYAQIPAECAETLGLSANEESIEVYDPDQERLLYLLRLILSRYRNRKWQKRKILLVNACCVLTGLTALTAAIGQNWLFMLPIPSITMKAMASIIVIGCIFRLFYTYHFRATYLDYIDLKEFTKQKPPDKD